jgi:hypothetical protein
MRDGGPSRHQVGVITQINKNDFWARRIVKDDSREVIINPVFLGTCEIVKIEKFLCLQYRNGPSWVEGPFLYSISRDI